MIDNIIFDFGDVFINLDRPLLFTSLQKLDLSQWDTSLVALNMDYEIGKISKEHFLQGIKNKIPEKSFEEIEKAWTSILADFPSYRLDFLEKLSKKYRLFLLSNTDFIHIEHFKKTVGAKFYNRFYQSFECVYYSFDMGLRKPDVAIFQKLIENHSLSPEKTLFVDDVKENTDAAKTLGINVWNLKVGEEDVIDLFQKNKILF